MWTPRMLQPWQAWALASAAFAALTAIFGKIGVQAIDSDQATLLRTIVVLFALGGIVWHTGHWQPLNTISTKTYVFLAISGLGTGASWLCYYHALKIGDAARVAPVDKLSVVFVAVLSTLLLGERLAPLNWFGIVLITLGAVLVART